MSVSISFRKECENSKTSCIARPPPDSFSCWGESFRSASPAVAQDYPHSLSQGPTRVQQYGYVQAISANLGCGHDPLDGVDSRKIPLEVGLQPLTQQFGDLSLPQAVPVTYFGLPLLDFITTQLVPLHVKQSYLSGDARLICFLESQLCLLHLQELQKPSNC